jgi:hypothetical protein
LLRGNGVGDQGTSPRTGQLPYAVFEYEFNVVRWFWCLIRQGEVNCSQNGIIGVARKDRLNNLEVSSGLSLGSSHYLKQLWRSFTTLNGLNLFLYGSLWIRGFGQYTVEFLSGWQRSRCVGVSYCCGFLSGSCAVIGALIVAGTCGQGERNGRSSGCGYQLRKFD